MTLFVGALRLSGAGFGADASHLLSCSFSENLWYSPKPLPVLPKSLVPLQLALAARC